MIFPRLSLALSCLLAATITGCPDGDPCGSSGSGGSGGSDPCDLAPMSAPICNADACMNDDDCARFNGTWCSPDGCADGNGCMVPWQCVPMFPAGATCMDDGQCCSGLCLDNGTCSDQVVDIEAHC